MSKYHKIESVWKRDDRGKFLEGQYSTPEIEYLAGLEWDWTEKIDGTNIRVIVGQGEIEIRGRTDNAQLHPQLIARIHELVGKPTNLAYGTVLYGEGIGAKIQDGLYGSDYDFILFDVRIEEYWLKRPDVDEVAGDLGLRRVTCVGKGTIAKAEEFVQAGFYSVISEKADRWAEGLVLRPSVPLATRDGDRIITKLKTKDYK